MSVFITNQEKFLADLLNNYIPHSKQLDFLVGYFYFSGFEKIYEKITDRKMRILVGMEADTDACGCIRESAVLDTAQNRTVSNAAVRSKFYDNLADIIGKADSLDTANSEKSFRFFINKLKTNTIEIRKTRDNCHAKMYIFQKDDEHNFGGDELGTVVVGSSNLSFQGLQGRTEVNVTLNDNHDYKDAAEIFEKLWKTSVPLADENTKDEFIEKAIKRTWLEILPDPYLLYVRVLREYFKRATETVKTPFSLTRGNDTEYINLTYQLDAISDGISILRRHSGCIIADVVGLGKSVIAATIAVNLELPVIIICPPHLKSQWEDFAYDFRLHTYRIYTPGKLQETFAENNGARERLVIVDEAHRYRNEDTEQYGLLHKICAGNKVLLLSATPFNNRPQDIFALIKLFQIPAHSTMQAVNNLGASMETLIAQYRKLKKEKNGGMPENEFKEEAAAIANAIRNILQPVLIRRTRVDLEKIERYRNDLQAQHIQFSEVNPPAEQIYELGNMAQLYMDTLEQLAGKENTTGQTFTGARYKTLVYLKDDRQILDKYRKIFDSPNPQEGQRNLATFMRQLLARRFESSVYSFKKTLRNIIASTENIQKWYATYGKVPIFKKNALPDFDGIELRVQEEMDPLLFDGDMERILAGVLTKELEKSLIFVEKDELTPQYIVDVESDLQLFKGICTKWDSKEYDRDPKLDGIAANITESLRKEPTRKIIVFSEFKDTVEYLESAFAQKKLRVIAYTSDTATKTQRKTIKENFDAGVAENAQKNDYDVLIATDAISEGFSLHRAGTIYNYDIPYNPTRVIQRVGRINRINKKVFDTLNIYNFFPSAEGEKASGTKSIAIFKMLLIQTIFGSDTQIFTEEEVKTGYLEREYIRQLREADEDESWDTPYRNLLDRLEHDKKNIVAAAQELPARCRCGRNAASGANDGDSLFRHDANAGVLLFSKKGDAYRFTFADESGKAESLSAEKGLALFRADEGEKPLAVTDAFYPLYQRTKQASGFSGEKTERSKNIIALNQRIQFIQKAVAVSAQNSDAIDYLNKLRKVSGELNSLPSFYIKSLLKVAIRNAADTVAEYRRIAGEEYLDSLLAKNSALLNEPETILLAEQFV